MKKQTQLQAMLLLLGALGFGGYGQIQLGGDIDGEAAYDRSGWSVSLSSDGNVLAIGAPDHSFNPNLGPGHVRAYKKVVDTQSPGGFTWEQLGDAIVGEAEFDYSGRSVSLSSDGSVLAIGAPLNSGNGHRSGHVRVYEKVVDAQSPGGFKWEKIGDDINGEAPEDRSGSSVSLSSDGRVLAIGARGSAGNGNFSGYVRVYKRDASDNWVQLGDDINGKAAGDWSGASVSLSSDGSVLAIGAPLNDRNGRNSGHVRVYKRDASDNWVQQGGDINGEAALDRSGDSVSLSSDGNVLAIGASLNDGNGENSGHVRVYHVCASGVSIGAPVQVNASSPFEVTLTFDRGSPVLTKRLLG